MNKGETIDLTPFRHLYPFQSHYLDLGGMKYHYLDEGRGEPILMVHGNPTWSFYYRRLVSALSDRFRTIVPDHIGCGLSDKPDGPEYDFRFKTRVSDLAALVDHLGITENLSLIVHDWGGAIGLALALDRLDRIKRLVILNTSGFFPPGGKSIPLRLSLVRNVRRFSGPAVLGLNAFARGAVLMAVKKPLDPEVKKGLLAPYNNRANRLATLRFVEDIPLSPGDPSYDDIKRLDDNLHLLAEKPMLICWGMRDFVFNRSYLKEWRRRFPRAEVHEFPDAGHYLLEDEPDGTGKLIEEFLTRDKS